MAKRIKAAVECKKTGRSSKQEPKAYFYLGGERFTAENHMEYDVVFYNSTVQKKVEKQARGREDQEKTCWDGEVRNTWDRFFFLYISLWLRSSDDQKFSGQY